MKGAHKADGYGAAATECGDRVEFFLTIASGAVVDAHADAEGCANTILCARAACLLVRGKPLVEARRAASAQGLSEALGGLPAELMHCAEFVADAMEAALDDAIEVMREPWRKHYRRGG
ncbi:MAG: iron-sulfur cluster assembly scaffold protein [Deltaproteobacteria bacterium]|nr:iron-sulfur cluster assembly scaffold protein [Deltaproteobacteria bacterium]